MGGKGALSDRASKLLDDVGSLLFLASPTVGGRDAGNLLPADLWTTPATSTSSVVPVERDVALSASVPSSSRAVTTTASTSVLASHYQDLATSMMGLDDI
ncbi:hypothetical protein EON62_00570 [archaeon]|nr:MAG: hypothetical protein EON62_00570 [archaeon]